MENQEVEAVEYVNGAEFGRLLDVGRSAISRAIKRGTIIKEKEGINPEHPVNLAYAENLEARNEQNKSVSLSKAFGKEGMDQILELLKTASPPTPEPETPQKTKPNELKNYNTEDVQGFFDVKGYKSDKGKADAALTQLKLAEAMGVLVRRKDVEDFWRRVIGDMNVYIVPLNVRIADQVAAICEVTEHKTVIKIRDVIADEIIKGLAQVQVGAKKHSANLTRSFS
jgi:hypothetical protein